MANPLLWAVVAASSSAWLAVYWLSTRRCGFIDLPNERSLHHRATPRSGGIGIVLGVGVGLGIVVPPSQWGLGAALLPLLMVSLLDDWGGLTVQWRLLGQLLTALGLLLSVALSGGELAAGLNYDGLWLSGEQPWLLVVEAALALLFIVWMINLYNFMDGMDGLAGSMAVIGFGGLSAVGFSLQRWDYAAVAAVVAAASAGFLCWNWPKARIFMGDTGSTLLGAVAAALLLWGERQQIVALPLALLIFSPFIVDATLTLARRCWAKEAIWRPHRSHLYQRLALRWGAAKTLRYATLLMLACALTAWLATHYRWGSGSVGGLLLVWGLVYIALVRLILRRTAGQPA